MRALGSRCFYGWILSFFVTDVSVQAACPNSIASLHFHEFRRTLKAPQRVSSNLRGLSLKIEELLAETQNPFEQFFVDEAGNIFTRREDVISLYTQDAVGGRWTERVFQQDEWSSFKVLEYQGSYYTLATSARHAPELQKEKGFLRNVVRLLLDDPSKKLLTHTSPNSMKAQELSVLSFAKGDWKPTRFKLSNEAFPLTRKRDLFIGRVRGSFNEYTLMKLDPSQAIGVAEAALPDFLPVQNLRFVGESVDERGAVFKNTSTDHSYLIVFGDAWYDLGVASHDYSHAFLDVRENTRHLVFLDREGFVRQENLKGKNPLRLPPPEISWENLRRLENGNFAFWNSDEFLIWNPIEARWVAGFAPRKGIVQLSKNLNYVAALAGDSLMFFSTRTLTAFEIPVAEVTDFFFHPTQDIVFVVYRDASSIALNLASGERLENLSPEVTQVLRRSWF